MRRSRWISIIFLLFCGLISKAEAANPRFDPQWTTGDSWKVAFTVNLFCLPSEAEPGIVVPTMVSYRYNVISQVIENGRNVVKILVEPEEAGWSTWLLTFDKDQVVLLSIEKMIGVNESIYHENPFLGDAWMAKLMQYWLSIIHDFPKIPSTDADEVRTITPGLSGTTGFTQSITFGTSSVTAVLSRTDPVSSLEHKTTIEWESGRKWWSRAVVQLGTDIEVSAVLDYPTISLSPSTLDFGDQQVGTSSVAQTITVTNTGTAPLIISNAALAGTESADFAVTSNDCPGAGISPGNSCAISVSFSPTTAGSRSASLKLTDNAPASPQHVLLTGNGTLVGLTSLVLNPTSVVAGSPSTGTITLSGPAQAGGVTVTLSSSNTTAATVPASITVAAGATTTSFPVTTLDVASTTAVDISATYAGVTRNATLTVDPPASVNNAMFVSQSVPTSMIAGQSYGVSVTMKNTGTTTWTAANNYKLGSQNPQDNTTWLNGLNRVGLPSSVAPNSQVTFNFSATAPSIAGAHNFQWRMIQDTVGWFGENTPNVVVTTTLPPMPPAAPSGLRATAVSSSQITLDWVDNSNNETGFKIERRTGPSGVYAEIATVSASVTIFSNTGLAAATPYFYRVRATNADGDSAYSNEISATTFGPPPAAPGGLKATAICTSKIKLSWTDNSADESGFKLERKVGAGAYAEIATISANVTSYTDTGLSPSTTYYYRVRAYNVSGHSAYSNEDDATTFGGTALAWGDNYYGQLGKGTPGDSRTPVQVSNLIDLAAIAGGAYHNLAVKCDGTVWAWGANGNGQLGDGTTTKRTARVQVSGLTAVVTVAAGYRHSLALKSDGTVWSWGDNLYGQLGKGTPGDSHIPVQVPGLSGVVAIAAGSFHSLAVKSDGTVWAWGANGNGQLGIGSRIDSLTPVQVSGLITVVAIAGGDKHSLALRSDGTVWAWGDNSSGQLGIGSRTDSLTPVQVSGLTSVVAIAAGDKHSLALKSDGTVWAWGDNYYGQLGIGSRTDSLTPVQVSGLGGVVAIAAGSFHSLAVKSDRMVWAWGANGNGQLGDGTTTNRTALVQVSGLTAVVAIGAGDKHSLALK